MKSSPAGQSATRFQRLEGDSQAVLELAAVVGNDPGSGQCSARLHCGDQIVRRATRHVLAVRVRRTAVDRSDGRAVRVGSKVRMVEDVECIYPELQSNALADLPGLLQRHIRAEELRTLAEAGWLVAHGSDLVSDNGKRCGVVDVRSARTGRAAGSGDKR